MSDMKYTGDSDNLLEVDLFLSRALPELDAGIRQSIAKWTVEDAALSAEAAEFLNSSKSAQQACEALMEASFSPLRRQLQKLDARFTHGIDQLQAQLLQFFPESNESFRQTIAAHILSKRINSTSEKQQSLERLFEQDCYLNDVVRLFLGEGSIEELQQQYPDRFLYDPDQEEGFGLGGEWWKHS